MMDLKPLIGRPYDECTCWDLIADYHGLHDIFVPEDILTSGKKKVNFIEDIKKIFVQIDPEQLHDGDVVLHRFHVALWVDSEAATGFIHAVEPYSEFVPVHSIYDARNGLNGHTFRNYPEPTFWRLIK